MSVKKPTSERTIHSRASFMLFTKTPKELADKFITDFDELGEFYLNVRTAGVKWETAIDYFGNEKGRWRESNQRQVTEDFDSVPLSKCRRCKGKITPYEKLYFRREFSAGSLIRFLHCYDNGYCEDCAKFYAEKIPVNDFPASVVSESEYQFMGDNYSTQVKVFSDGSVEESNPDWGKNKN